MNNFYKKVAVIGRPNVGKSTLFNRLLKERKSIVDDTPGVTRDRLYADIDWNGKGITLIDTGGLELDEKSEIYSEVQKHVFSAIDECDFVLFMVDGISGATASDEKIAKSLRKIKNKKRIFLAVNKVDTEKQKHFINDFYSFGLGDPYPVSALCGSSALADILDEIAKSSTTRKKETDPAIKIAIVGKPNVGKSSLLNCLSGSERSIVTSIAGTTRDTIDTRITVNKKEFLLIDTAGLRRKSKVSSSIERYANDRTIRAIERSDVVLLVIESTNEISDQEQKIAALIKKRNKASIIISNKWDLVEEKQSHIMNSLKEKILKSLHFIDYSEVLFTSALNKKNVFKVWEIINSVYENYSHRVTTNKLNKVIEDIVHIIPPPTNRRGKSLKMYYVTQSDIRPPEIVFFVNDSDLVKKEYEKFLERQLREYFNFVGTPLKLVFRNKKEV